MQDGQDNAYAQALPPGSRIGNMEIIKPLGRGAFAFTYLARKDHLDSQFAVKEFFPDNLGLIRRSDGSIEPNHSSFETFGMDFRNEARIISGLSHPSIVNVYDMFDENNTHYYVMPYYPGHSMDMVHAQHGVLTADQARRYLDSLMDALEYIHNQPQPIFHRDIKPANILLNSSDDTPILIDFGTAKRVTGENTAYASRMIGTDHYRAPEQIAGSKAIGPWTDIYGLSAAFYRLISGELPEDSQLRSHMAQNGELDPLIPLADQPQLLSKHGQNILNGLDQGLRLRRVDRPQSVAEWRKDFERAEPIASTRTAASNEPPSFALREESGVDDGRRQRVSEPHASQLKPEEERGGAGKMLAGGFLALAILGGVGFAVMNLNNIGIGGSGAAGATSNAGGVSQPRPKLSEPDAWLEAFNLDTAVAYQSYLEAYPNGENAPKARVKLTELETKAWASAQQRGTIAGYQEYLSAFPEGAHASDAQKKIEDIRRQEEMAHEAAAKRAAQEAGDWNRATSQDTISSYESYLNKHSSGPNASDARSRRDSLVAKQKDDSDWVKAMSLNTSKAYETYLNAHPKGAHVAEAMQKFEDIKPKPGKVFADCIGCPQMVVLPTSSFRQGASVDDSSAKPNEKPARDVSIDYYIAMGITEVSFDEWFACVSDRACNMPDDKGWGQGRRPVINVTWGDAQKYTGWLSRKTGEKYRLPTESEWEYAARAGEAAPWPKNNPTAICAYGNSANAESGIPWANNACRDPVGDKTMPTGSLLKNAFGVKDMIGNVGEWTSDCNTLNYRRAPSDGSKDPNGNCRQNVVRGGSWFSGPKDVRFSARLVQRSDDKNDFTGFRVVKEIEH